MPISTIRCSRLRTRTRTRTSAWLAVSAVIACLTPMTATLAAHAGPPGPDSISPAGLTTPSATKPSALRQAGRWLVDEQGRVVIMHGVNVVPTAPATSAAFDDDDAAFLARNGFTVVRLGWQVSALEPQPGTYDDAYLATFERTVNLLARHGIYTLVDMHQDEWGPSIGIRGFPDWMTLDDGQPASPTGQFHPVGYWTSPAINRAWKNFWSNAPVADGRGVQDVFARQWRHAALRFKDNPFVLG